MPCSFASKSPCFGRGHDCCSGCCCGARAYGESDKSKVQLDSLETAFCMSILRCGLGFGQQSSAKRKLSDAVF